MLLEVNNLQKWYPVKGGIFGEKKFVKALNGVSFTLEPGKTLGLVGESGCGKSTLAKTIMHLQEPTDGNYLINDIDITALKGKKLRDMRTQFQMIFQDPYSSLNPKISIANMLDEILYLHSNLTKPERKKESINLLKMVGLNSEHINRYPHQFSGGQRQRIGIARALAVKPKLIIADEPVSALDVSVQAQIINLLKDIQNKTKISYLFIAHDLAVVEHICDRIMVMYLGKIVEEGPAEELCSNPSHPYTKALLSAIPTINKDKKDRIVLQGDVPSPINIPSGCSFHTRCQFADDKCANETPILQESNKKEHRVACFKFNLNP